MRILWLSNAPWTGSGYGEQTALFAPRLRALGHDVALMCNFGLRNAIWQWNGLTVYPDDGVWGNRTIGTFADHFGADLIIALCDSWVMRPEKWPEQMKMAIWAPIDHYPVPPLVLGTLSDEKVLPIAMSRFGETQMRQADLEPLYVPHGVDTDLFKPDAGLRAKTRAILGLDDEAFLVGMVAANHNSHLRKGFSQAFLSFSRFAKDHPNAHMYVHTRSLPIDGRAQNLEDLVKITGCPTDRTMFPPNKAWDLGITREDLRELYLAMDVLLMPSMGEGFGVPLIEAQACGVPVITSDHSAMTELGQEGWLVKGDPFWIEDAKAFLINPSIDSVVGALEQAYERRHDQQLRDEAVAFAAAYDANAVTIDYWLPALEKLTTPAWSTDELVMDGQPESRQVRRARERKAAKATA